MDCPADAVLLVFQQAGKTTPTALQVIAGISHRLGRLPDHRQELRQHGLQDFRLRPTRRERSESPTAPCSGPSAV